MYGCYFQPTTSLVAGGKLNCLIWDLPRFWSVFECYVELRVLKKCKLKEYGYFVGFWISSAVLLPFSRSRYLYDGNCDHRAIEKLLWPEKSTTGIWGHVYFHYSDFRHPSVYPCLFGYGSLFSFLIVAIAVVAFPLLYGREGTEVDGLRRRRRRGRGIGITHECKWIGS